MYQPTILYIWSLEERTTWNHPTYLLKLDFPAIAEDAEVSCLASCSLHLPSAPRPKHATAGLWIAASKTVNRPKKHETLDVNRTWLGIKHVFYMVFLHEMWHQILLPKIGRWPRPWNGKLEPSPGCGLHHPQFETVGSKIGHVKSEKGSSFFQFETCESWGSKKLHSHLSITPAHLWAASRELHWPGENPHSMTKARRPFARALEYWNQRQDLPNCDGPMIKKLQ